MEGAEAMEAVEAIEDFKAVEVIETTIKLCFKLGSLRAKQAKFLRQTNI